MRVVRKIKIIDSDVCRAAKGFTDHFFFFFFAFWETYLYAVDFNRSTLTVDCKYISHYDKCQNVIIENQSVFQIKY